MKSSIYGLFAAGLILGMKRRVDRSTVTTEAGVALDAGAITVPPNLIGKVVTIIWETDGTEESL